MHKHDWSASSARGQHTSIYRGLLSSRKFSALSPDAKLAFYTLKIRLPIAQIEKLAAWSAEIAYLTGLTEKRATAAIKELCQVGMCAFDGRTMWIVDGLKFDPCMAGTVSPLLAKGIRRHLAGLQDCDLTAQFKRAYPAIFRETEHRSTSDVETPMPNPLVKGSDVDEEQAKGAGTRSIGKGSKRATRPPAAAVTKIDSAAKKPRWHARVAKAWESVTGGIITLAMVGRTLGPLVDKHGATAVLAAWAKYLDEQDPTYRTILNFATNYGKWAGIAKPGKAKATESFSDTDTMASPDDYLAEMMAARAATEDSSND